MFARTATASARRLLALATLLAAAACSDDTLAPPPPVEGTLTVDAADGWAYVDLDEETVVDPSAGAAEEWDIAFSVTGVMLNGGAAGEGGVVGHCICQNAGATNAEVLAMTAASELADFEGVTAVPAGAQWVEEALTPVFTGWYTGSGATAVADPAKTFLVRLADGTSYAKIRVVDIEGPTAATPGAITFEHAVQPTGEDAFGETLTQIVAPQPNGTIWIDLDPEAGVPIGEGWDLRIEEWDIRLNGGLSGEGEGGALVSTTPFDEITTAYVPNVAYKTDAYAGVFGASPWYRYNLEGNHRVHPTFNVYLLKRGETVYKVQLLSYYGDTGQARHITFRYERIAP